MTTSPIAAAFEAAVREAREMDAPLCERLAMMADTVRGLSAHFAAAVDRLVERLQGSGAGAAAPGIGDRMPAFVLPDEQGRLVHLDQLLAQGPVAVSFNRGHWCPYCRIATASLAEIHDAVRAAGGQIVAITPERRRYNAELKSDAQLPFPILTDMDNGYALSLNLAIWVGAELEQFMTANGRALSIYQGNSAWMLPIPATFVIASDGRIRARYVDPDFRRRMALDELLAAIRAAR